MSNAKTKIRTDYLHKVYTPKAFNLAVKRTIALVKSLQKQFKFTAIAFTGSSGAAVAFPVAYATKLNLIHVRKTGDRSHWNRENDSNVEGVLGARNYIIIDDFISSGNTIRRIICDVNKSYHQNDYVAPKCVAIVLYSNNLLKEFNKIPVMSSHKPPRR